MQDTKNKPLPVIFCKPAGDLQPNHPPDRFADNPAAHLGATFPTFCKYDRDLGQVEFVLPGGKFHFHLEGIALAANLIELDGLKDFAAVTDESCRRVPYL